MAMFSTTRRRARGPALTYAGACRFGREAALRMESRTLDSLDVRGARWRVVRSDDPPDSERYRGEARFRRR
jgi:hypothetical protein